MRTFLPQSHQADDGSFLPQDYIDRKAERRSNAICLTLFFGTLFALGSAFFVTQQRWDKVTERQKEVHARYTEAQEELVLFKSLEAQKKESIRKAELTAAITDKTPASRVFAEIINRLPEQTALNEYTLKGTKITSAAPTQDTALHGQLATAAEQGGAPTIAPLRMRIEISLVGQAVSHNDAAAVIQNLRSCGLIAEVNPKATKLIKVNDRELNKFEIDIVLKDDADARDLEPLLTPRIGSAMQMPNRRTNHLPKAMAAEQADNE